MLCAPQSTHFLPEGKGSKHLKNVTSAAAAGAPVLGDIGRRQNPGLRDKEDNKNSETLSPRFPFSNLTETLHDPKDAPVNSKRGITNATVNGKHITISFSKYFTSESTLKINIPYPPPDEDIIFENSLVPPPPSNHAWGISTGRVTIKDLRRRLQEVSAQDLSKYSKKLIHAALLKVYPILRDLDFLRNSKCAIYPPSSEELSLNLLEIIYGGGDIARTIKNGGIYLLAFIKSIDIIYIGERSRFRFNQGRESVANFPFWEDLSEGQPLKRRRTIVQYHVLLWALYSLTSVIGIEDKVSLNDVLFVFHPLANIIFDTLERLKQNQLAEIWEDGNMSEIETFQCIAVSDVIFLAQYLDAISLRNIVETEEDSDTHGKYSMAQGEYPMAQAEYPMALTEYPMADRVQQSGSGDELRMT
ncbi:MAG: hypothetical protein Q9227_004191 [Pyrenula ochraceoflavens]